MRIALIVCFIGLLLAPCTLAAQELNGVPTDTPLAPAGTINCWVSLAPFGEAVTYVPESSGMANGTFWLNYAGSRPVAKLTFLVNFNPNSPLGKYIQRFEHVTGSVTTPFAYPFWSNHLLMGPAALKVTADKEKCQYLFETGGRVFESEDTPSITDLAATDTFVTVSGIDAIRKVAVTISIIHPWVSDLHITLIGPDGTAVDLSANNGLNGHNYGCTGYQRTVFDDQAATPITSGTAPFIGLYRPQAPLSAFIGKTGANANGTWTLRVVDELREMPPPRIATETAQHVEGWSLIIAD